MAGFSDDEVDYIAETSAKQRAEAQAERMAASIMAEGES